MQVLIEFLPLAAFLVAYKLHDVYVATAVLMAAMPLMLLLLWLRSRKLSTMQVVSTVLVLGFGTLTLVLRDPRFIQWKPTIFLWGLALAFLVTGAMARVPLVRTFLGPVAEGRQVTSGQWRSLNWQWVAFCVGLGAVNLAVARMAPEKTWVTFKVFGITAAMMVMVIVQALRLQRLPAADAAQGT